MDARARKLIEELARITAAEGGGEGGITLGELYAKFWDEFARFKKSGPSIASWFAPILSWKHEGRPLRDHPAMSIRPKTMMLYKVDRMQQPGARRGTTVQESTVRTEWLMLKRLYRWGIDEELLPSFPLERLKIGKPKRRKGHVRAEQVMRIARHLPDWAATLVVLMAYTGMRVGTALTLRWTDVDFETGRITPSKPESDNKRHGEPCFIGGDKDLAEAAMLAWRTRYPGDEYVFQSKDPRWMRRTRPARPYSVNYFRRIWHRACEAEGITTADGAAVPHHTRHFFKLHATETLGLSLPVVAALMGHASITMTMSYGSIDAEALAAALERARSRLEMLSTQRRGPRGVVRDDGTVRAIAGSEKS